jgi:hypothetical protein
MRLASGGTASIDQSIRRELRAKAAAYDKLAPDLPKLRYPAKRTEEPFAEIKSLRCRVKQYVALSNEILTLRAQVNMGSRVLRPRLGFSRT